MVGSNTPTSVSIPAMPKQLQVSSYFIVHFYWGEPLTEEGAGIELLVSWIVLGENHPNSESVIVQPSVSILQVCECSAHFLIDGLNLSTPILVQGRTTEV